MKKWVSSTEDSITENRLVRAEGGPGGPHVPNQPVSIFADQRQRALPGCDRVHSRNTQRAYDMGLREFWRWASASAGSTQTPCYPVPVDLARLFLMDFIGAMPDLVREELGYQGINENKATLPSRATVCLWVSALSWAHRVRQLPDPFDEPAVAELARRIRYLLKSEPLSDVKPILLSTLEKIIARCVADGTLVGARDAAYLLASFSSGGCGRLGLMSARLEDMIPVPEADGYVLRVARATRLGQRSERFAPVFDIAGRALKRYLEMSGLQNSEGPIFRSVESRRSFHSGRMMHCARCASIIKRRVLEAGLDPSGHSIISLRAGFIEETKRNQIDAHLVRALTHATIQPDMSVRQFISFLISNPAARLTQGLTVGVENMDAS